ncbi:MAG: DUF3147 family protein [Nanoarchaeota archaeon]|nr:DUF3147 family protein [Nanoarchaeota archaeon]
MIDPFIFKLILSFIVGGLYVALSTTIAEKFGSKIGGLITGLPSTIVISLFFIGWSQGINASVEASTIVPVIEIVSIIFVLIYAQLLKFNRILAPIISLAVWFILALPLAIYNVSYMFLFSIIFVFVWILVLFFLRNIKSKKITFKFSYFSLSLKIILTGFVVLLSVLLSKILGPLWGGVFSVFPAIFLSTFITLSILHKADFSSAVGKTMPIGTLGIVLYGILVYFLYPPLGLIMGTILSYLISVIAVVIVYKPIIRLIEK